MIQSFKLPLTSGRFLVTAVYSNRGVPAVKNPKVAQNETVADNIIRSWEKEVLREKISKFLNHRQNVMDYHGGLRTMEKLNTWETVKKNFDFLFDKSLEANCKFILISKQYFESLMPGKKSRFHQSTEETMREIYAFCESRTKTETYTKTINPITQ